MKAIFDLMDVNNDRFISKSELKSKLLELDINTDDRTLERLIRHIDQGILNPSPSHEH